MGRSSGDRNVGELGHVQVIDTQIEGVDIVLGCGVYPPLESSLTVRSGNTRRRGRPDLDGVGDQRILLEILPIDQDRPELHRIDEIEDGRHLVTDQGGKVRSEGQIELHYVTLDYQGMHSNGG